MSEHRVPDGFDRPTGTRLAGLVCVVTGASRGIGAGLARRFAAEGAKVVCAARTRAEGDHERAAGSLATTLGLIHEAGGDAVAVSADVGTEEGCGQVVAAAVEAYGPVDVLVNNAALTHFGPIAELDPWRWRRTFDVNVHAPMVLSHLVLPAMLERGTGCILNISSGASRGPGRGPYDGRPTLVGGVPYGVTKAALERFTQGLAEEVWPHVSVVALSPSAVVPTEGTRLHAAVFDSTHPTEPLAYLEEAALHLVTAPVAEVSGRICASQEVLAALGRLDTASGAGVDRPATPFTY